ncbi:hypothetical protein BZG36_04727 [Bifiguratus adelaidae]|uniref:C2H2-type domain-containing protein n=1 Tax=Bifiguratus adelaidae TaxID=1938954 RepID=A0A261XUG5_9FUNG|nr:hypothetical protein BZG36_04727 [Bifiguratus adelaidae]
MAADGHSTPSAGDKVLTLVVDSGPLLKRANIAHLAEKFVTIPEVIHEIRDEAARQYLSTLPFELETRSPKDDAIHAVVDFAKKTGDYATLSVVDVKVLALAYTLEVEANGTSRLRSEPVKPQVAVGGHRIKPAGKANPSDTASSVRRPENTETIDDRSEQANESINNAQGEGKQIHSEEHIHSQDRKVDSQYVEPSQHVDNHTISASASSEEEKDITDANVADEEEDDSDGEWITPKNVAKHKSAAYGHVEGKADGKKGVVMKVACMTTDFAMQNVLLQMRLNLLSVDGLRIRKAKSWVLRCHACYKVTTDMEKKFCPSCGNATLMRTSCSTDEYGNVTYYLKKNFQYNLRGTKYSIPESAGGRNATNMVLREDQREYQKALRRQRKQKENNLFDPDYTPSFGVDKDVTSQQEYASSLLDILTKIAVDQDSEAIRTATSTLNTQFYTQSACVPALYEIATKSPHWQVKQLAAVELRKRISKWWVQLDQPTQDGIRQSLPEVVLQEQHDLVRHSLARVIAAIAKIDIPERRWDSLLGFLHQCCTSGHPAHREVGVYVIYTIFETASEIFIDRLMDSIHLFGPLLSDPESKVVRVTSLQTLGKVAEFLEPDQQQEINTYRELIPAMVNVLQGCLHENDEENATKGFEVFDTLLMLETPLVSKHLSQLVEFFINVGANKEYDESIRVMGLSFLMWAAVYKQSKLKSLKLVAPIIERVMPIGVEEEPEDIDEEAPSKMAFKVLNSLATNLPPQQVFPHVHKLVMEYMQSGDANARKAGMMALAVVIEGCADYIRPKYAELLPIVCTGLQDHQFVARRAACICLGAFADELPDEIAESHAVLLPLVLNLMDDSNADITKQACNALDAILESLQEEVLQYLPTLMEKLIVLLDNATQNETKATVTAAIGSAAHSAGAAFQPYFNTVIPRLQHLMTLKDTPDDLLLRGVATDTVGAVAEAVGKEAFAPFVQPTMQLALEGMQYDNSRLRECSYCLYAILARVFEGDFAVYLPTIMPQIFESCRAEEKDDFNLEGEIDLTTDAFDDDDDLLAGFNFNSAIADEKEVAADALGELFQHTRSAFLPYVENALNELVTLSAHISEGVRKAVVGSLFTYLKTFYLMSNPPDWQAGLPVKYSVHENVANVLALVVPAVFKMWEEEDDKGVVTQICAEFNEILRLMGPAVLAEHHELAAQRLTEIFDRKSVCQTVDEEDGDIDQDELAELESMLISSASDMVGAMALVLKDSFAPYLGVFIQQISKYYKPSKPTADRSMAVGCLGEVAAGVQTTLTPFTDNLMNIFLHSLTDEEEEVKSNAAYGIGVVCAYSQNDVTSQYQAILSALYPLFQTATLPNATDNATGAVARMILRNASAVPLDQVLPVFVTALPLKVDFQENEPVYQCIISLFQNNNSFCMSHIPSFLNIFQQVLPDESQLQPATRQHLIDLKGRYSLELYIFTMVHPLDSRTKLEPVKAGFVERAPSNGAEEGVEKFAIEERSHGRKESKLPEAPKQTTTKGLLAHAQTKGEASRDEESVLGGGRLPRNEGRRNSEHRRSGSYAKGFVNLTTPDDFSTSRRPSIPVSAMNAMTLTSESDGSDDSDGLKSSPMAIPSPKRNSSSYSSYSISPRSLPGESLLPSGRPRRLSEVTRKHRLASLSESPKDKANGTNYRCEECGKVYKHPNCLSKHRWEHSEEWGLASKFLLSKHQQVQLLEAAAILVNMDHGRRASTTEVKEQMVPLAQE